MIILIIVCIILIMAAAWSWVDGFYYLNTPPNYKKEDNLLDEFKWDDNKQHTEQGF